jgi:thiamine-phosphate pyrophosphorylase
LINDRVDAALAIGADGVHVGQGDMSPKDAREILGPKSIIGLTIKNDSHAEAAPVKLLNYVCIGGVYNTLSKDNPVSIGLNGWKEIAAHFRKDNGQIPVGAIAGIDASNVADVIAAGADGVAIIAGLFMAHDVEQASRDMLARINAARTSA